jgi:hypothetical protein
MFAASIFPHLLPETSVNFYQYTQRNNPGDSHLHNSRRQNLTFHYNFKCYFIGCETLSLTEGRHTLRVSKNLLRRVRFQVHTAESKKMTMKTMAVSTSENSANFYTTTRSNIQKDGDLLVEKNIST